MLLNAQNLQVAELASSDAGRQNLNGLYVCPLVTVATDGHCLGAVTTPTEDPKDFPNVAGITGEESAPPPAILPVSACKEALKAIPTKAAKRLPILGNVYLTGENGTRRLVTTDIDSVRPLETKTEEGDTFPDWQGCIPGGQPALTVAFNPALLAKVLTTAAKMGARAVKMEFRKTAESYEEHSPLVITATLPDTGQQAMFLVMPVRL